MTDTAKPLVSVGTTEFITLPDDHVSAVPAKIDTGADGSSIWASNIHIKEGKLIFNLFAAGSAFYSQEPIVSTAFRVTMVKNSFGAKEFRYKIRLRVKIGERTLTRWFSLADRSNNTFPVLLGKNFLKNVFIVDVAHKYLHGGDDALKKVLILTSQPIESGKFFDEVRARNIMPVQYTCVDYDALVYYIDGAATRVVNAQEKNIDLTSYHATYFKSHHNRELGYAAAEYLHFKNRLFVDQEYINYMSSSKLSEYMKLTCYGIAVPATICAKPSVLSGRYAETAQSLGIPFVLKEIASDKGQNNYLIGTKKDFADILRAVTDKQVYLAQKFIPNDGFYRINVFRKEVGLAVWRSAVPHENKLKMHLNKPRGGVNAVNVPLSEVPGQVQDLALRSASCMNRQFAGVDLVQDKISKKWYVLEVNNDPQIRTGAFLPEKAAAVAEFFDKELHV